MLSDDQRSGRLLRLATTGVVAYSAVFPLLQVALLAEGWDTSYERAAWALGATALYLPLHLRHVHHAVRGTRPPGGVWGLVAMAVIIIGVTPLAGSVWLSSFHALIVSALLVLRPPWSLLTSVAVVVVTLPLALTLDSSLVDAGSYYTLTVVWRASAVFVPVWLVGTLLQLQAARQALAEDAVVRERLRIDDELRRTLGIALDAIATRGRRASVLVEGARPAVDDELRALVDGSRRTLADARQMIRGYQPSSLRGELDVAATLLSAAGIRVRMVLPAGELPETAEDTGDRLRATLRTATAQLLRDPAVEACVITVTEQDRGVGLTVRRDDMASARSEAAAS